MAVITEANLQYTEELHEIKIQEYNITTTLDYREIGIRRLVILTRKDLRFQVLHEKMETSISTIWLKFPRVGRKPFYLMTVYREHHLLNQLQPNNTGGPMQQRYRLNKMLTQWNYIKDQEELMVVGDLNQDYLTWKEPDQGHLQMMMRLRKLLKQRALLKTLRDLLDFGEIQDLC